MSTEENQELEKLNLITERIIGWAIEVHRSWSRLARTHI